MTVRLVEVVNSQEKVVMSDSEQRQRYLLEGRPGESLFCRPILDLPRHNELPELFQKVEGMDDERLLAIVTALIVENRLDHMLPLFLPRYSVFKDVQEFNFAMKIRLLQALDFIPPLIPTAAHCIRAVRNEFAHDLSRTQLSEIKPRILQRLRAAEKSAYMGVTVTGPFKQGGTPREVFRNVATYCIFGLDHYAANLRILREYISQPGFVDALSAEAHRKSMTWLQQVQQQMQSGTPLRVEQQGDKIIEHFAGGVARVHDAQEGDPEGTGEPR
jgi:hypothetical protein